jgi:NAD(P)H-flavin reductase
LVVDSDTIALARVTSVVDVGGEMSVVTLAVPDEAIAATYTRAGQYVRLGLGSESGYFVLAHPPPNAAGRGAPVAGSWQILIKGGGVADRLLAVAPGSEVCVSPALGEGFPTERARSKPLMVVVGGTGFAAARALVPQRIDDGYARCTSLFVGMRRPQDVPVRDELGRWAEAGVQVTVCLSRPSSEDPIATGPVSAAVGYVQDVVRAKGVRHRGPVFVVGPLGLIAAMRDVAHHLGGSPADVFTNV